MLKSYEGIYENGQIKWLAEQPPSDSVRVIVTVLEEPLIRQPKRHFPIANLAGTVKILGDIVSPIVDEEEWECLK